VHLKRKIVLLKWGLSSYFRANGSNVCIFYLLAVNEFSENNIFYKNVLYIFFDGTEILFPVATQPFFLGGDGWGWGSDPNQR